MCAFRLQSAAWTRGGLMMDGLLKREIYVVSLLGVSRLGVRWPFSPTHTYTKGSALGRMVDR